MSYAAVPYTPYPSMGNYIAAGYRTAKNLYNTYRTGRRIGQSLARATRRMANNSRNVGNGGPSKFNPRPKNRKVKKSRKKFTRNKYLHGVPGANSGNYIRKGWKKAVSKNSFRNGITLIRETGSIISDADCVYLGHGPPMREMVNGVWRQVLKQLFEQAGLQIQSFDKDVVIDSADTATNHTIRLTYYRDVEIKSQTQIVLSNIPPGSTITQIADGLITAIQTSLAANLADGDKPIFTHLRYIQQNIARPTENEYIACMFLETYNVTFEHKSYLKMQNITPAGNAAALDEDRFASTNVEAVTLRGKAYKNAKWKNCFSLIRKSNSGGGSQGLLANPLTSIISATYTDLLITGEETFSKPPPAWQLGAKKEEKVSLEPGKIMRDKVYFSTKIGLNKFHALVCELIKTNDYSKEVDFGISHVFALEKMIDMRLAGDANITIGYEVDFTLKVKGQYKKPPTMPLVDVD